MYVWIGTAGYSYPEWVGPVYPSGTPADARLGVYARSFPLVELNHTFYGIPDPASFDRLVDRTPDGFLFAVKVPKSASHEHRTGDLPAFRAACGRLARGGRLAGMLAQFPESFGQTAPHRAWVEALSNETEGFAPLAVEFRHRSWATADVPAWLIDRGLDLVSVDVPDLPDLYPRGLVRAGRRIYARFHSRARGNWYAGGRHRYDYDYPDDVLRRWAADLARNATDTDRAVLVFNNCVGSQAVANGRRMAALLAGWSSVVTVVGPFAPPGPRQLSLFGDE